MSIWFWFSFFISVTADEIINLPGVDFELNFKHYSGYLDASPTRKLHYWFVESQNDPSTDPLILWFNGGPGCSSLLGLLQELGPFLINADGETLHKNEYSWNKNASVLFIESPAGTGFSYSTDGNTTTNDNITAIQNYEAIKHFYSKFPQFSYNDVYITGESYAGIFIPTLAVQLIDGLQDFNINLKGIAIGNGWVSGRLNFETALFYVYSHGLIDEEEWEKIMECCDGKLDGCQLSNCNLDRKNVDVNPYDIHSKCSRNSPDFDQMFTSAQYQKLKISRPKRQDQMSKIQNHHRFTFERKVWSHRENQDYFSRVGDDFNQECVPEKSLYQYLNTPAVRSALHIPSNVAEWEMCNSLQYHKSPNDDQSENIKKIVANKVRTLLYYGDVDTVCNFLMGQKFSNQLGLEKLASKTAWYYDDKIIGGYKTEYNNLTFLTINGAGHMVPQTHPRQMQHILRRFIDAYSI